MASVQRRGDRWRAQVYRRGVRDSYTCESEQEAWDWAAQREREIDAGVSEGADKTLAKAVEKWASTKALGHSDQSRVSRILSLSWARIPIRNVTAEQISTWRDERLRQVAPGTVARELNTLRSILTHARRDLGWLEESPMRDVRTPQEPPPRRRLILPDEIQAMLEQLDWHETVESVHHEVAVAMLLALETAMRAGEILGLTWDRVQPRKVLLEKTKNGDRREVPLSSRAVQLLELMRRKRLRHVRAVRADNRVFHIDAQTLDQLFRRARVNGGMSGFRFHDTRATGLTRLAKILTPLELARMVGHRDLASLLIYFAEPAESLADKLG